MPSLGENRGPYSFDYNIVRHREKNILTILNNPAFDSLLENIEDAYEYTKGMNIDQTLYLICFWEPQTIGGC